MTRKFSFTTTEIPGLTLIQAFCAEDERGYFLKDYSRELFERTKASFVHCISSVKSSSLNWSGASLAGFTMLLLTCAWIPPCSRNGSRSSWTGKPIRNC